MSARVRQSRPPRPVPFPSDDRSLGAQDERDHPWLYVQLVTLGLGCGFLLGLVVAWLVVARGAA